MYIYQMSLHSETVGFSPLGDLIRNGPCMWVAFYKYAFIDLIETGEI